MKLRKFCWLLTLLVLIACEGNDGNNEDGLRDLSPSAIIAKSRTLKLARAISNYWPTADGSRMLVLDAAGDTSLVDLARGDAVTPLKLEGGGQLTQVEWSPDANTLAYTLVQNGASSLYLQTLKGRNIRIATGISNPTSPTWADKGQAIYFLADKGGQQSAMNTTPDGKTITPMFTVAEKPSQRADFLRPSPDDTQFVYNLREAGSNIAKGGIYIADAAGRNRRLLAQEPSVAALHVSPRGDRLLVEQSRGTYVITATFSSILWFSRTRGGERKLLLPFPKAMTNTPPEILSGATTLGAAWSSTGDKIIYITHNYAATAEPPRSLWVVNADGGDPAEVYTSSQETDLNLLEGQTLVWTTNNSIVTTNMGDTFTIIQLEKRQ